MDLGTTGTDGIDGTGGPDGTDGCDGTDLGNYLGSILSIYVLEA